MYAYSMAAAHEKLPHLQMENYMVSNVDSPGEGWPHIDTLEDVCASPTNGIYQDGRPLPTVVHFCQSYRAGDLGFQKRRVPKDIFTCESPMFVEPPAKLVDSSFIIKNSKVTCNRLANDVVPYLFMRYRKRILTERE